jgi:hypothetical protein
MVVDQKPSEHAGLISLSVPIEGVAYVLSGWSGQGSLFQALRAVEDPDGIDRAWDDKSIRSRAGRILLEHIRADLQRWPQSLEEWLPHLPIASTGQTLVSQLPHGRVDWRETMRQFGWPARAYVTRLREREIADVTVSTLAWTVAALDRLATAARDAGTLDNSEEEIYVPLAAARAALALTDVPDDLPRPDRHDLESLRTSGRPWSEVDPVAAKIVRSETDLNWFALQLLAPDPDFKWRLYHLAVLGHTLMALRAEGALIRWRTPMGAGASGPNFVAAMPDGTKVDIWFEAAGAREHYGFGPSVYRQVVRPVRGSDSAIGPDVALYIPDRGHALILECKFSWSGSYVGRNGYHQAAGYALNEHDAWDRLWSYVIGPEEKIAGQSRVDIPGHTSSIRLGVTAVPWVSALISEFLDITA